jgi:hypothetical protein
MIPPPLPHPSQAPSLSQFYPSLPFPSTVSQDFCQRARVVSAINSAGFLLCPSLSSVIYRSYFALYSKDSTSSISTPKSCIFCLTTFLEDHTEDSCIQLTLWPPTGPCRVAPHCQMTQAVIEVGMTIVMVAAAA